MIKKIKLMADLKWCYMELDPVTLAPGLVVTGLTKAQAQGYLK